MINGILILLKKEKSPLVR